jgi:hypothetical protein
MENLNRRDYLCDQGAGEGIIKIMKNLEDLG